MTVKELIEELKKFDENLTVLIDTEGSPHQFQLFVIQVAVY